MNWLNTIRAEAIGLFVDDGSLALAIVIWLALCWALLPRLALPAPVPAVTLFAGLAAILVENALRRARASRG